MLLSTRLWLAWIVLRGRVEGVTFHQEVGRPIRLAIDLSGETAWQYRKRMSTDERGPFL